MTSPTSDPIAVDKESEDSLEDEDFTPDLDDFTDTLHDLLDEDDDVIEVSWTKSPLVTNNKNLIPPFNIINWKTDPCFYIISIFFPKIFL